MKIYKNILVPYDFEAHSREALKLATQLATPESSVTVVHAYDPKGYQAPSGYVTYTHAQSKELGEALLKQLHAVAQGAVEAGACRMKSHLLEGTAAGEILRFAREGHFDLIVMGTHGRTGVWQKLLGSLAQEVLAQAPCPVMTIRVQAALDEAEESRASGRAESTQGPAREASTTTDSSFN